MLFYGLNRARATHCRATRSIFAHIWEQNRAAMAERLLDTQKMGGYPVTLQTNYAELEIF